jgi:hypothetical protein
LPTLLRQTALPANRENNYHSSVQPQITVCREETDSGCRIRNLPMSPDRAKKALA